MDATEIQVGSKVQWTHVRTSGLSMRFSTREGTVAKLGPSIATVRLRNGRTDNVLIEDLRLQGRKSALTEAFQQMAAAVGVQEGASQC